MNQVGPSDGKKITDDILLNVRGWAISDTAGILVNFFGFQHYRHSYLLHKDNRKDDLYLWHAVGIHLGNLEVVPKTCNLCLENCLPFFPTYSMLEHQNLKCLLVLAMQDDSIDRIYDTLKQTAKISQSAGGIDFLFTMFVQQVLYIRGTNGTSTIVPMLSVFNDTARILDQGGGK
jgi:ribonucleoside-diphosphate reductase alpha chain